MQSAFSWQLFLVRSAQLPISVIDRHLPSTGWWSGRHAPHCGASSSSMRHVLLSSLHIPTHSSGHVLPGGLRFSSPVNVHANIGGLWALANDAYRRNISRYLHSRRDIDT